MIVDGEVLPARLLGYQCDHGDSTVLVGGYGSPGGHAASCTRREYDWGIGGRELVGVAVPLS